MFAPVQGHNPEDEVEVAYPEEEDDLVEYDNEGYAQDLLDEQDFEGEENLEDGHGFGAEGYPEEFAGRPATHVCRLMRLHWQDSVREMI